MSSKRQALSPVDTAWLHMDDPTNLMMVTGVCLLDGPIDYDRLRRTVEARLLTLDRFTMRLAGPSLHVGLPHWEVDPTFNYHSHVHRVALPEPGDMAALHDFMSDLASTPLDESKPLWQMHVIDNVMGGSAMALRFHHAVGDGVAMVGVMTRLLDEDPDAPIELPDLPQPVATRAPRKRRSLLGSARSALGSSLRIAGSVVHESVETIRHPSHLRGYANVALSSLLVLTRTLAMEADPQTPLKGKLGVQKRTAWSPSVPLTDVKEIGRATDAKVNDVLVAAVAGALRHYVLGRGASVDGLEVRAVLPVNLRTLESALELGNGFGIVFLGLPLSIPDPLVRLAAVKHRMDAIKESPEAILFFGILGIAGASPNQIEDQLVNIFESKATMVLTNVPGPKKALYLAGLRIRDAMFWVPQAGHMGLGISILSYDGRVALGVITDAGLIPDPETIATRFAVEFEEMLKASRQRTKMDESPSRT
jgi:diacylglycerol O-acyltransferase